MISSQISEQRQTCVTNSKNSTIQGLNILQDQLKRQYLLLQREQRQKVKIKKQIQNTIQDYYSVLVQKKGLGKVITQDKLSNSYNFVKDLVINISKDVKLGFQVLLVCTEQTAKYICPLLIGMFYENLAENDPYLKKNTRFAELLGSKISQQLTQSDQNFLKKANQKSLSKKKMSPIVQTILKQFCKLQSIKQYFQMLANRILNKIPQSLRNATGRNSLHMHQFQGVTITQLSQSQSISFNRSNSNINFQSLHHQHQIQSKIQQAVEEYKADIINKAQMMPTSLRVLIYKIVTLMQKSKQIAPQLIHQFIWQILQVQYFKPFDNSNPKKWNHFQNSYFSETVNRICETMRKKIDQSFRNKLIEKIMNISRDKLNKTQQEKNHGIIINGGCVSYMNLFYLFKVIKQNQKTLKGLNQRVVNRVNKINEMNPNFQFFKDFSNPSTSYLVFFQLVYGETLQKDYQGMYISIYNQNKAKDMLKQILSDTTFHILPYIQREKDLKQILQKVIKEQQMQGEGSFFLGALQYSSQFVMKVKYLVYLMNHDKQNKINQSDLFSQMIKQCLERQRKNLVLFKKNKIQLLQCLTTVTKSRRIVKIQKQTQKNVDFHLKIVKILDTMEINICITGPSTRPQKDKFLKTQNQGLIIQNASTCAHQENIQQGLRHHANNVLQAITLFCQLKQVRNAIETGKDTYRINQSLTNLIDHLKSSCKTNFQINIEEYNYFQNSVNKVIMRQLHQILIDSRQKTLSEIELQKKIKDLGFIRPNKIKIAGRDNLAELEQVWQIACRYLKVLNQKKNPIQKIQTMLQMIEVIKISIRKEKNQKEKEKEKEKQKQKEDNAEKNSIEIIIAYCIIRARPEKILFNINFMQVFLPKDKLMAKQGGALQRLKNAVLLIQKNKITQYLILDQPDFQQQLFRATTLNSMQDMKQSQKLIKSLAYL